MQNNLLSVVKLRVMDELRYAIQQHQVYRDSVECYHKFPISERPSMGVILKNASASRIKLSADDCAGTLKSHLALAKAENKPYGHLSWVWEDPNYLSGLQTDDLSSQIVGTPTYGQNRVFYTTKKPIIAGQNNTDIANNFRQVSVLLNGQPIFAEFVDGKRGMVILPQAPVAGSTLQVTYYYSNLTLPGRYYVEIAAGNQFIIDPFYQVRDEEVIGRTTGTEITAHLDNSNIYGDFDVLYTLKTRYSNKIYLVKDSDYTLTQSGLITFLNPLPVDTTLYANYRWVGNQMGPFPIPEPFHYDDKALPGVILAFTNQLDVGSRMVVIVYPDREPAAQIFSGHYRMSFEIDVFAKDPIQLPDLTDHLIETIWGYRRLALISEGLTIEEMDPTGESEEAYDNNTGDLYYKNSISLQIMTEWKKYVPFLTEIMDFDTKLYQYITTKEYIVTNQNQVLELRLLPFDVPFEVVYPKTGYARIM